MAKILMSYKHYPVTIAKFFRNALLDAGHQVWTVGTFSDTVPWDTTKDYSRHIDTPNLIVDDWVQGYPVELAVEQCGFNPDCIISIDAGFHLIGCKNYDRPNAVVLTDPHALGQYYEQSKLNYNKIFNMQKYYKTSSEFWLPYAFEPKSHYWMGEDFDNRTYDVCILSGLLYPERRIAIDAMRSLGFSVYQDSGILYEDGTRLYNNAVIAFNWSSQQDLCARFFEGLAYRNLVIANRVPDMVDIGLTENLDYVAFDDIEELIDKVSYYSINKDKAWEIASRGYAKVWSGGHTYHHRVNTILDVLFPNGGVP